MRVCSIDGCLRKHAAKGYCKKHYYRIKLHGYNRETIYDYESIDRIDLKTKINPITKCKEWILSTCGSGYGSFRINGKLTKAHRFVWEHYNGKIPKGMNILHRCDNPKCCEISHLFLGTQADNVADMVNKKRYTSCSGAKNGNSKLTEKEVIKIKELINTGMNQYVIARHFNITQPVVSAIKLMKIWKHISINNQLKEEK